MIFFYNTVLYTFMAKWS